MDKCLRLSLTISILVCYAVYISNERIDMGKQCEYCTNTKEIWGGLCGTHRRKKRLYGSPLFSRSDVKPWIKENRDGGYAAKHIWLSKYYKVDKVNCEHCGIDNNNSRLEWSNISGDYKRSRDDYRVLCTACHQQYDKRPTCIHGHMFDDNNTYYYQRKGSPNPERGCRMCRRNASKQFKARKRG